MPADGRWDLTLILLTWRIWWAPNNASIWQMGFNSVLEGLIHITVYILVVLKETEQICPLNLCFSKHQRHILNVGGQGTIQWAPNTLRVFNFIHTTDPTATILSMSPPILIFTHVNSQTPLRAHFSYLFQTPPPPFSNSPPLPPPFQPHPPTHPPNF